jgi:DNA helicase-2/ATP-dependent DNA helicase PcrA
MYEDMDDEATDIATTISTMAASGTKFSNFLVLYRTNAQSRAIEEAMLSNRIPYVVVGGTTFYERKEIRDLLSYLRLAEGRGDVDDMKRCINAPFRFLGKAFIDRCASELSSVRKGSDRSIAQLVVDAVRSACRSGGVQGRQRESANDWCDLIDEMHVNVVATQAMERRAGNDLPLLAATSPVDSSGHAGRPATVLEQIVLRTQYSEWITRDEGQESTENNRLTNVRELIRAASRFRTAHEFLDYIDDTIKRAKAAKKGDQVDRVTMMSVHRSKGLEWPNVFVIGANEGIFPHSCADAEEERRLFYVAITRAKDTCQVSSVRVISTSKGVRFMPPSPFIGEASIPNDDQSAIDDSAA